ncbi:enoyl-CoA hydratase/isomerase family protein [Nocardioides sp. NPDC006303]|uniref:enoyl-CoA hydratase/isomerase family protein n=1 Tax=Nocardioides sp. NPDC006303 TaxID=3156747 RepID=UPI0033B2F998
MHLTVDAGLAVLELRRPEKRNAVTAEMWEAIVDLLAEAAALQHVRVLAIQGSGGVFCAGADLSAVKTSTGEVSIQYRELAVRALSAIASFPAPSVAVIDGACVGGGCSIALACDLRFATPESFFRVPAVRHGIVYDEASMDRLIQLLGPSRAAHFMCTAATLSGDQAHHAGLVDECTDRLDIPLEQFVAEVAQGDWHTVARTRALLRKLADSPAAVSAY